MSVCHYYAHRIFCDCNYCLTMNGIRPTTILNFDTDSDSDSDRPATDSSESEEDVEIPEKCSNCGVLEESEEEEEEGLPADCVFEESEEEKEEE